MKPDRFISEMTFYRAAWKLLRDYGASHARELCDEHARRSRDRGDVLGLVAWLAIKGAVGDFDGRTVH